MKLGPFYVLWTKNWLELMKQLENSPHPQKATGEVHSTPKPTRAAMFTAMEGWSTRFMIDGEPVGGQLNLSDFPYLLQQLDLIGGAAGKRILELGPLEGGHTLTLCNHGAREVIAIEGFPNCWLRCLIVKEAFALNQAHFLYGDFCSYVADYDGPNFDFVLASGVLYHQMNPVALICDLARITDCVLVWSQVAGPNHPSGPDHIVEYSGEKFQGRLNDYRGARHHSKFYCGGVGPSALWLYPEELRRAFHFAGFTDLSEGPCDPTPNGPAIQFVARKPKR